MTTIIKVVFRRALLNSQSTHLTYLVSVRLQKHSSCPLNFLSYSAFLLLLLCQPSRSSASGLLDISWRCYCCSYFEGNLNLPTLAAYNSTTVASALGDVAITGIGVLLLSLLLLLLLLLTCAVVWPVTVLYLYTGDICLTFSRSSNL